MFVFVPDPILGGIGAPPIGSIPELEDVDVPSDGADLSFVTAFFKTFPFLISPNKAFLLGVTFGSTGAALLIGGGIPPGGGGGGGGGGGPIIYNLGLKINKNS